MKLDTKYCERMFSLLKEDYDSYLKSLEQNPSRAIRMNSFKTNSSTLSLLPFSLEKIPYTTDGFYVLDSSKLGTSVYHDAGAYYVQEPSAMIVVNSVDIKPDAFVLDLCASPGGKTSQIASKLKDGILVSNEINPTRAKILLSNVERLGLKNVIVTSCDPEQLASFYSGMFDYVFVDAPCSGEGMFRKDEQARRNWSYENVIACSKEDRNILNWASQMVKKDGFLLYSTCTFSKEENEDVIHDFLKNHKYQLEPVTSSILEYTYPGIGMEQARRFYPFFKTGEGQFVVCLKCQEIHSTKALKNALKPLCEKEKSLITPFLKENIPAFQDPLFSYHERIVTFSGHFPVLDHHVLACGVTVGEITRDRFIPHHQFFSAYGSLFLRKLNLANNDIRLIKYLKGEEMLADISNGYGVVQVDHIPLGGFKAVNGKLKNYYPKGLRKK